MTNDPQNQAMSKYNGLQSRARRLIAGANLNEVMQDIKDIDSDIIKLPGELARMRSRGYTFASNLDPQVQLLSQKWGPKRDQLQRMIEQEVSALRAEGRQVENLLNDANRQLGNPFASTDVLTNLEREINDLDATVKAAEQRVQSEFEILDHTVSEIVEQVQDIHGYLDQQDEASFPFLTGEKLFLAAHSEWIMADKGGQDPDGILFLTDQRLIFEQKEKTGKMLGLFGGKHTQELKWQITLDQINGVEAENKGLLGRKDFLYITLNSAAPYSQITVEVKGKANGKFWAEQIQRMTQYILDSDPALVIKDVEVYPEADSVVSHGLLKQGAIIRLGPDRFRGKGNYTLVSGEGPAKGWVDFHALRLGENE